LQLCSVFIGSFCVFSPLSTKAQVIEIGPRGDVRVYDGPAVVTASGVMAIERPTPALRRSAASARGPSTGLAAAIADAARSTDLSAALISAIAWRESNFSPSAVSRAGALGEMQLLPQTARRLGVDPRVTRQNVAGGAAYVRALLRRYDGDLVKTLAAYNAGPKAVDRYGGVPPFKETQAYVAAVLERLSQESLGQDKRDHAAAQPARTGPHGVVTQPGLERSRGLLVVGD
jgi:soluble lytic murein transglycosylase-like protein